MSKLDDIRVYLNVGDNADLGNRAIALCFGVDEGMVRRARNLAQLDRLNEEISRLTEENEKLKDAIASQGNRPLARPKKIKPEPVRLLWESLVNGEVVETVPML